MDGTIAFNSPLMDRLELSEREIDVATFKVLREAQRREHLYRRGKPYPRLEDRTVIRFDDGLASGYSMVAAVTVAKSQHPPTIIAAPVASDVAFRMLGADRDIASLVMLVHDSEPFFSLSVYYRNSIHSPSVYSAA